MQVVSPVEKYELGEGHHGDQADRPLPTAVGDAVFILFDMESLNCIGQMNTSTQGTLTNSNVQGHYSLVGRMYFLAEGCRHQVYAEEAGKLS